MWSRASASASGFSGVPAPAGPLGIFLLLLPRSGEGGVAIQFHRRNNRSPSGVGPAQAYPHSSSNSEAGSQASLGFCVNVERSGTGHPPTTVTSPNPTVLRNHRNGTRWQRHSSQAPLLQPSSFFLWHLPGSPQGVVGLSVFFQALQIATRIHRSVAAVAQK